LVLEVPRLDIQVWLLLMVVFIYFTVGSANGSIKMEARIRKQKQQLEGDTYDAGAGCRWHSQFFRVYFTNPEGYGQPPFMPLLPEVVVGKRVAGERQ